MRMRSFNRGGITRVMSCLCSQHCRATCMAAATARNADGWCYRGSACRTGGGQILGLMVVMEG